MALEFIGALVAAATLGLMAWALRRKVPSLPRWLVPVAAGVGLIGTTVWLEYTWFGRVSAELPEGFVVADTRTSGSPLRPWTYVVPLTSGFTALDATKVARHPQQSTMVIAPVYAFARWQNPQNALVVFDCAGNRRVPVTEGMEIGQDGTLTGAEWLVLETRDVLQEAACQGV
jgi:hypothetical protein